MKIFKFLIFKYEWTVTIFALFCAAVIILATVGLVRLAYPVGTYTDNMAEVRRFTLHCKGLPEVVTYWNVPAGQPGRKPVSYRITCLEQADE